MMRIAACLVPLLAFMALCLLAGPAVRAQTPGGTTQTTTPAATPISRDQANTYYMACLKQPSDPRLNDRSRQALCACNAAQLTQNFSAEDYAAIGQGGPTGVEAFRRFLLDVYTPCMSTPIEDIVANECMQYPNMSMLHLKTNPGAICACAGRHTAAWFENNGRDLMKQILQEAPGTVNPFDPAMASPVLKRVAYEGFTSCIGGGQ